MTMIDSELMTIEEVARRLRIGQATIRKMISDGRIRAAKIGNRWRVIRESVDEYLQNGGDENARDRNKSGRTKAVKSRGGKATRSASDRRTKDAQVGKREPSGDAGTPGGGTATTPVKVIRLSGEG